MGAFRPLTASHGNVSAEIAEKRNAFLEAEMDLLVELLKDEETLGLFEELLEVPPELLFSEAEKRLKSVMKGEVPDEDLFTVEKEVTLLYAAIQDKILLLDLVKRLHIDKSEGRSR